MPVSHLLHLYLCVLHKYSTPIEKMCLNILALHTHWVLSIFCMSHGKPLALPVVDLLLCCTDKSDVSSWNVQHDQSGLSPPGSAVHSEATMWQCTPIQWSSSVLESSAHNSSSKHWPKDAETTLNLFTLQLTANVSLWLRWIHLPIPVKSLDPGSCWCYFDVYHPNTPLPHGNGALPAASWSRTMRRCWEFAFGAFCQKGFWKVRWDVIWCNSPAVEWSRAEGTGRRRVLLTKALRCVRLWQTKYWQCQENG